ncbi:MAG: aspartate-semialdehyde dehydrogenase [Patiriisocius sp.]|jgi:aspartate-semialdehyde dehydrogenase
MKIALVGATGMVGNIMMKVVKERNLPYSELIMVASERSAGKILSFDGKDYTIRSMAQAVEEQPDIALFSAGGDTSLEWAPQFEAVGCTVIDNSSAWRMSENHKLIVPEINAKALSKNDKIIANPNCSTIQLVLALAPLHDRYKINRLVISTYQSITGTGVKAVRQLENERNGIEGENAYPYKIDKNCLPHCDVFTDNGYTKEEMKLVNETRKIIGDQSIMITATAVRVPVEGGHSEAVNIEFENDFKVDDVRSILSNTPGVVVQDDIEKQLYPTPLSAKGKDDVFVGRIRRDESREKSLNMWIVSDNLRKGAATNAVQIAEHLIANDLV